VGATSAAWAKPKVAVTKIEGDSKGSVQGVIEEAIQDDVVVAEMKEVKKAIAKLDLGDDLSDPADVGKLEKAVHAKAVIVGTLDKKGETMALHIKIYTKPSAKPKAFTVKFSNANSEKFKKSLHDTLIDKLGDLVSGGGGDDAAAGDGGDDAAQADDTKPKTKKKVKKPATDDGGDDAAQADDTKPKTKKKKHGGDGDDATAAAGDDSATDSGDDGDDKKPKTKKKKHVADGDDSDGGGGGGGGGGDEDGDQIVARVDVDSGGRMANRDAVRVESGISFEGRQLTFATRSFPQQPRPYKNAPVPGARVAGELYPFALSNQRSAAAGLGIGFSYDKTLSLKLQTTDPTSMMTLAGTANEQNYDVDARYRIVFGKSSLAPSLTLSLGYGKRQFLVVSPTSRMSFDIPDVAYKAYLPGAQLRLPFTKNVVAFGGGQFMLVTDAGQIEDKDQYGQGTVIGFSGSAGLDFVFGRFAVRVEGELSQVGFAFKGNGTQAVDRDGDPTTPDVGGASDRYYGGAATFGVLY
jgi:hypothetical protein